MTADKALRDRWTEAGLALAGDPKADVPCPTCWRGRLSVTDTPHGPQLTGVSRKLSCNACGAHLVLNIQQRPSDPFTT